MKGFLLCCAVLVAAFSSPVRSETPAEPPALYRDIARLDAKLFDAFNAQDLKTMRTLFTKDLEFYQDNEGLVRYAQTIRDFKTLFKQPDRIRRELVDGSMKVFPVKDYGAIQTGQHRFCHDENGKPECGTFDFVHIWRQEPGGWRISRVISYNH